MSTGGAVAGFAAIIAAKKRGAIFTRFRNGGALSAATAAPLPDLGLSKRAMFSLQELKGAIVEAKPGLYYLDEDAVAILARRRRSLILGLLATLVLGLLIYAFLT